jgi:hypothetical protein
MSGIAIGRLRPELDFDGGAVYFLDEGIRMDTNCLWLFRLTGIPHETVDDGCLSDGGSTNPATRKASFSSEPFKLMPTKRNYNSAPQKSAKILFRDRGLRLEGRAHHNVTGH